MLNQVFRHSTVLRPHTKNYEVLYLRRRNTQTNDEMLVRSVANAMTIAESKTIENLLSGILFISCSK